MQRDLSKYQRFKNDLMQIDYDWDVDIHTKLANMKRYKSQYYTMTYPTDKIRQMKFQTSEEISAFLLRNAMEIGYCKWQLFEKEIIDKGEYIKIVYSCRKQYCDATLIYLQKKSDLLNPPTQQPPNTSIFPKKYFLAQSKIINYHRHIIYLSPKISNETNIRQYLNDLPVEQKFENHVETIKQKFNLTKCQAKFLRQRLFWKFKDQDHMLQKLSQRKIAFRRKIENGKTGILIIVSQSMRKNYGKFGDNLSFDITYKLLKKKVTQPKHLGVGFFVGQDENSRIVVFAVSTIQHQTSENFQKLFSFFFEIMTTIPQTILTDDQKALGYALQMLKIEKKYTYIHLLDWYHKIEALKRATKRQSCNEQLFTLFNRLMKQPSKQVYFDIVCEICSLLQKKNTMIDYINGQEKYSLCQVPYRFFAFGISSTRAQSFNGLIKRSVPHQTNFGRFIYFVLRVQKRLLNRMNVLNYMNRQLTKMINDQQILMLSQNLEHLAFQQIRQYYEQSRTFEQIINGKDILHKSIPFFKYQRSYKSNLFYDLKCACWRCQCGNNFRTGMPCSHIVRIVRQFGGSVSYYINQRWYHDKQNAIIKKASRPNIRTKKI